MSQRYTVEQTGPHDWSVWDDADERHVYDTTTADDAEDQAEKLNAKA